VTEPETKDEKLQRRKRELEEELDRYAQAGVASPNLLKVSRWVSRILYLGMAALAAFLLFSGWGKYSKQEYEAAVSRAHELEQKHGEVRKERDELESKLAISDAMAVLLRNELDAQHGAPAADRAQQHARALVERAFGEIAYAAHWREKLKGAQPDAHGVEPVDGVKALIRQAAVAPAAVRFELLREAADFGEAACRDGATALLEDKAAQVRATAALLLSRAGDAQVLAEKARTEADDVARREVWFAWSVNVGAAPDSGVWTPEAWVGYTVRRFDAPVDELATAYRSAPEESRTALLALLAVSSGSEQAALMRELAVSPQRSDAERIMAVRWFADRNEVGGKEVLTGLAKGSGAVAAEAARSLDRLTKE
jgi:hypothetical protein